ncbi:MAG: hypothetical protein DRJ52_02220 [Thermoprotei archaeon]|nr:MAG: hypothetical protein DRJ52_02220 [Thermoprotei archaeon]RLF01141.1 MAG: hypothetical protein DRJ63_00105 [Thermoprotei archaeon]HDI74957.1 hypothetical protein [Thermoprotei archaeon]
MYPYYYAYPRYYYPLPPFPMFPVDPMALLYTWPYLWLWYISMMYYIELYKVMIDMWKKWAETALSSMAPPQPGT